MVMRSLHFENALESGSASSTVLGVAALKLKKLEIRLYPNLELQNFKPYLFFINSVMMFFGTSE